MLRLTPARLARWLASNLHSSPRVTVPVQHALSRTRLVAPLLWCSALAASAAFALQSTVHLDAPDTQQLSINDREDSCVDPATSIGFPTTLRIPSKTPLPTFSLVGVGVRTVSFLGIKVYSVGFYADLNNPRLDIPRSASPEEKIEYLVRNSACVMRIVPTRSTTFGHLRDGFMRALQTRLLLSKQREALNIEQEVAVQSPLRKFKSMFPNTPLAKHTPLDVLLTSPTDDGQPRSLVVRDLGSVQSDWLATEFFLSYFEGDGLSPPLKKSVVAALHNYGR